MTNTRLASYVRRVLDAIACRKVYP